MVELGWHITGKIFEDCLVTAINMKLKQMGGNVLHRKMWHSWLDVFDNSREDLIRNDSLNYASIVNVCCTCTPEPKMRNSHNVPQSTKEASSFSPSSLYKLVDL